MEITLSKQSLEHLRDLITGDRPSTNDYKKGYELVSFFNDLGFQDTECSCTRWVYVQGKLELINGSEKMHGCILQLLDPRNYIQRAWLLSLLIKDFNEYLEFDGYQLKKMHREIKLLQYNDIPVIEVETLNNEFIDEELNKIDKN